MRRLLPLIVAVLALQACGAEEDPARFTGTMTVQGFGIPVALQIPLSGVASQRDGALDMEADPGKALARYKPEIGSWPVTLRVRGDVAYVKLPRKPWARVDLRRFRELRQLADEVVRDGRAAITLPAQWLGGGTATVEVDRSGDGAPLAGVPARAEDMTDELADVGPARATAP